LTTYSRKKLSVSMTCRTSPPRNAMSEPARIGTCRSLTALVRPYRGSTWMSLAPFSRAFIAQRNPTGCASARFEPWIRMQSAFWKSCW
jgi:hypothetical protein